MCKQRFVGYSPIVAVVRVGEVEFCRRCSSLGSSGNGSSFNRMDSRNVLGINGGSVGGIGSGNIGGVGNSSGGGDRSRRGLCRCTGSLLGILKRHVSVFSYVNGT